jgi:ribonuclease HI
MSSGFITNYSQESDGTFKGILNTDLIIELYNLMQMFDNIKFFHVKAHNKGMSPFNEWCDTKAKEEMKKLS